MVCGGWWVVVVAVVALIRFLLVSVASVLALDLNSRNRICASLRKGGLIMGAA